MLADGQEISSRGSLDFVESSILSTIVPQASKIDIEGALRKCLDTSDAKDTTLLSGIAQRPFLFFGALP
jgi:hypothetical protein